MNKFSDYIKFLKLDYKKILYDVLNYTDVKDYIIYLNQEKQLSEGIDSLGQKIVTISAQEQGDGNVYSKTTIVYRQEKGLQVDKVDLKFNGDFWNTFDVDVTIAETEVIADTSKGGGDIKDNFESNFDFLGLTNRNLNDLSYWLLENYFGEKIRQKLMI